MDSWVVFCVCLVLVFGTDALMMRQFNRRLKPSELSKKKAPEHQWFPQVLDHFDPTNPNKWKQRYHVINEYYQQGGPAFLMVEGEWEASGEDMYDYASVALAKKLNGIVFELEHRYYGQSRPTSDLSVANLKYLSADQALLDAAFFIEGMTSQYQLAEGTKWVVFGGSYAANLAAWLRYKFPHLVYASVAYSGPLLAKLNFYEYKSYVRDTIKKINKHCINAIKSAHRQVEAVLKESKDLSDFSRKFKLCDPLDITNTKDVGKLFEVLGDNTAGIVQNNRIWSFNIESACKVMLNETIGDYIDRYAELNKFILDENCRECMDFKYDKYVEVMKNVSWESEQACQGERQWTYQTCTEFAYFQTSYKPTHLFTEHIPLDHYIQLCADIYGEQFNKQIVDHGVKRTNVIYGGQNIKATKVAYVFGKQDPWLPLGMTEAHDEAPSIVIEGESHCACLYGNTDLDTDVYKSACNQIEGIVTQWCQE